jgi:hypothetical protein
MRLLGLLLLVLAIAVPGCQALMQGIASAQTPQQIDRAFGD